MVHWKTTPNKNLSQSIRKKLVECVASSFRVLLNVISNSRNVLVLLFLLVSRTFKRTVQSLHDPNKNSWILYIKRSFLCSSPLHSLSHTFFRFGCLDFERSATNKQIRLIFFLKLFDSIEIIDWRCSAMLSWSDCSKWPYKGIKRENAWWMGKDVILDLASLNETLWKWIRLDWL